MHHFLDSFESKPGAVPTSQSTEVTGNTPLTPRVKKAWESKGHTGLGSHPEPEPWTLGPTHLKVEVAGPLPSSLKGFASCLTLPSSDLPFT